ncbi:hypothetical protein GALMADRAFT_731291 [Galerina marginata CBS 339.88]|uniref:Uncharacterized protein n=1 Tax=Galerina marginata (strain CBS 339.88) TaxID=685588 RepID=A0A067SR00_GALM3|nr:hypothetical protein GALMADRAFT_731291 [Galerina marginata CBS 339.88]
MSYAKRGCLRCWRVGFGRERGRGRGSTPAPFVKRVGCGRGRPNVLALGANCSTGGREGRRAGFGLPYAKQVAGVVGANLKPSYQHMLTPTKAAEGVKTCTLAAEAPHMRTPAQYEPHMSSYCLPATVLTPTKAAGAWRHPLAARAPHMRALTQHEPHMSSCCMPVGTPTPTKDAGDVETHLLTAEPLT